MSSILLGLASTTVLWRIIELFLILLKMMSCNIMFSPSGPLGIRSSMKKKKPPFEIKMLIISEIIYGLSVWGIAFYFWLINPNFELWQIAIIFWPIVPYCLAYFIWIGERRVWKVALIIAIVLIPGSAGWCLLRHSWTGLVDIICNIPIIFLLTRPKVQDFFEKPN